MKEITEKNIYEKTTLIDEVPMKSKDDRDFTIVDLPEIKLNNNCSIGFKIP